MGKYKDDGFYKTSAWTKVRRRVLERDHYLCQSCLRRGVLRTANTVHHIVELEAAPELALTESNLESLCRLCHEATKERRKGSRHEAPHGVRIIKA